MEGKRRSRLVNFRVTDEEYARIKAATRKARARSISAFARDAVLAQWQAHSTDVDKLIEDLVERMKAKYDSRD